MASSLSSEPESDPEELPEDSAFLAAFLATGFSSEELSESEEESLAFFYGTTAFSVFFCALLALPLEAAETFEAALDLF